MEKVVSNEISYEDLAKELGISISALRGLLTLTLRRTSNIERVRKNGKGWVKYADHSSFFSNNGVWQKGQNSIFSSNLTLINLPQLGQGRLTFCVYNAMFPIEPPKKLYGFSI